MELTDRFTVRATPQRTWELLFDLPRVARCLPGCEDIHALDETTYRARMAQRVGPFQVAMDLDLKVGEVAEGRRVVVTGGGKDRMGNTMRLDRLAMELQPRSAGRDGDQLHRGLQAVRPHRHPRERDGEAQGPGEHRRVHAPDRRGA